MRVQLGVLQNGLAVKAYCKGLLQRLAALPWWLDNEPTLRHESAGTLARISKNDHPLLPYPFPPGGTTGTSCWRCRRWTWSWLTA